jgi:eukaryotic-like serine/threonine-protein kinase
VQASLQAEGQAVGNYRIVRVLGEGGMGVVYEAVHPILGRRAAIKVLKLTPGIPVGAKVVERFFTEARLVASLGHENIVEAFDFGEVTLGGVSSYYVAMELLEGESLRAALKRGPLAPARVAALGRQAAAALGTAHASGVVHRDVKPDNLFLARRPDGREVLKILDFGIAKLMGDAHATPQASALTKSGIMLGTPAFMSPEQCAGRPIDGRSDVYSLGLVLFQAATGKRPFARDTEPEVMAAQLRDAPPRPSHLRPEVPLALEAVLLKALAKRPEHRFATMEELAQALRLIEEGSAAEVTEDEVASLLDACTATRVVATRGSVDSARSTPRAAPSDAVTHTIGKTASLLAPGATTPRGASRAEAAADAVPVPVPVAETVTEPSPVPVPVGVPGGPSGPSGPTTEVDATVKMTAPPGSAEAESSVPRTAVLLGSAARRRRQIVVVAVSAAVTVAAALFANALFSSKTSQPAKTPTLGVVHLGPAPAAPRAEAPAPDTAPASTPMQPVPAALPREAPREAPIPRPAPVPAPVRKAHLSVQAAPWAKVYLDGRFLGETPLERDVPPGSHMLRLVNESLSRDERIPLKLAPGERKQISRRWQAAE